MNENYSDLGHWEKLSSSPELYSWSECHETFFDLRMLALRLTDGTLLVYSPIPLKKAESFQKLEQLGQVSFVLAPNHFHNLGIKPFKNRYPTLQFVASEAAIPRLQQVTKESFAPFTKINSLLPGGVNVIEPEGLRAGELWMTVRSQDKGFILIVCDAYFNMPHVKKSVFGKILWLTGGAPGLRVSRVFRLIGMQKRKVYRQWTSRLFTSFPPKTLIPSHGAICTRNNLADELLALI